MSRDTLTVLMPAFNAGRFIGEAIDSVLRQTHRDFRFVIVDDGSTDDTREVAEAWSREDPRIEVHSHANCGIANTLNGALERIDSEWVVCMHADDVMLPNRIERQLAFVAENSDLAIASSLVCLIDENGREIGRGRSPLTSREAVKRVIAEGECVAFHHPAVMMRRDAVLAVGGYRQDFWPAEDTELWNRIVHAGHGVLVQPEYLLKYRIHGSSASMSKARLMVRKLRWMEECMQCRRAGQPEPGWDEFLAAQRRIPLLKRINERRKEMARTIYQASIGHFASRKYHRLFPALLAAAALEPKLVLPRVLPRIVEH